MRCSDRGYLQICLYVSDARFKKAASTRQRHGEERVQLVQQVLLVGVEVGAAAAVAGRVTAVGGGLERGSCRTAFPLLFTSSIFLGWFFFLH